MAIKADAGFDKADSQSAKNCSPCVERTLPNTASILRKTLETRPGAVLHTDAAEISVAPVGGARYFVTLNDRTSKHVNAFHMKIKSETSELLKRQVKRLEKQTESKIKKIVLD